MSGDRQWGDGWTEAAERHADVRSAHGAWLRLCDLARVIPVRESEAAATLVGNVAGLARQTDGVIDADVDYLEALALGWAQPPAGEVALRSRRIRVEVEVVWHGTADSECPVDSPVVAAEVRDGLPSWMTSGQPLEFDPSSWSIADVRPLAMQPPLVDDVG